MSTPGGIPPRALRRVKPLDLVVLALALAAVFPVARLLELPDFVDRLSVVNTTPYDIGIDARGDESNGWVAVGIAGRSTTSTFERIIDQGEAWVFRFSAQGQDAGELRISREELKRDDWQFRIPEHVTANLAAKGTQPPLDRPR